MEQNDIQSQHIDGQRWLIRKLIQNQQTKQIKACSTQLIEHPAAGFTSYLIGGITVMILTMSFALASINVVQPVQPIEVTRMEPKAVFDTNDDVEINAHIDRWEIQEMNEAVRSAIYEKLGV